MAGGKYPLKNIADRINITERIIFPINKYRKL
jgi:hypothetical protein